VVLRCSVRSPVVGNTFVNASAANESWSSWDDYFGFLFLFYIYGQLNVQYICSYFNQCSSLWRYSFDMKHIVVRLCSSIGHGFSSMMLPPIEFLDVHTNINSQSSQTNTYCFCIPMIYKCIYSCRPCLRRPRCTRGASAVQLNVYCSSMIIELVILSVSTQFIHDMEPLRRELGAVLLI
jgi:hypothetical protein